MRICLKCGKTRRVASFSYKNKERGTLVAYCKPCNRQYQKWHYQNNPIDYKTKRTARRKRLREEYHQKLLSYLVAHPCADCGESDPVVLEFDHVRGRKSAEIANLLNKVSAWTAIEQEIRKCAVRCANCHKRKTAKKFGWYKAKAPIV